MSRNGLAPMLSGTCQWLISAQVSVRFANNIFGLVVDDSEFTTERDRYGNIRWRWRNGPFAGTHDIVMALVRWDKRSDTNEFNDAVKCQLESFADTLKGLIASINDDLVNEIRNDVKESMERRVKFDLEQVSLFRAHCELEDRYVYLFRHSNGLTKIGLSKDPRKREKTLQAEDPRLHMLAYRKGGSDLETRLHKIFADRRFRGEWFQLSQKDVEWIVWLLGFESGWDTCSGNVANETPRDRYIAFVQKQLDAELA